MGVWSIYLIPRYDATPGGASRRHQHDVHLTLVVHRASEISEKK
jgi:hypothetical protein